MVQKAKAPEKKPRKACAKAPAPVETVEQDGKPLNSRQEKFAVIYAAGRTGAEAYEAAYGPTKAPEAAASRLLTIVKVRERVAAIQEEARQRAVLTLAEKRQFLRRVVLTPISQVGEDSDICQEVTVRQGGGDRGRLKRGPAHKGNEVHEEEYQIIKLKMPDKLRAIELDAKLAGELREQVEVNHSLDTELAELLGTLRGGG